MTEEAHPQLLARRPNDSPQIAKNHREEAPSQQQPVLELGPEPATLREWLATMWAHRGVTYVLARKDFQVRYKRAALGVLWAVAVPVLQAAILIIVFSQLVHLQSGVPYGAFVLSGIFGWNYFSTTLPASCSAIVDGTELTDKVWFPRAILALVPCLSGLVGLAITMGLLLVGAPILGAHLGFDLLLLIPACALLVLFTIGLGLVTSALQVYFRDVRFIVGAALMVWLYATPIMYPETRIGHLGKFLSYNPMTGIVTLFHLAILGHTELAGGWLTPMIVTGVATVLLLIVGAELQRRRDRVFVDLL